jgi:hypothetical protein
MPDFGIFRGFNEKLFGNKLYAGQLPTQLGLIGSTDFGSLLLDFYPNAAAAYSLRKLRAEYTGNAIRVRRASDNTEQDIGFVNNVLDTSSLTSFCSGTNGFVTTWYDQSGNGYDATQTTAANQPQIVSSGSVILENSKPSIKFDGFVYYLTISNLLLEANVSIISINENGTQSNVGSLHKSIISTTSNPYAAESTGYALSKKREGSNGATFAVPSLSTTEEIINISYSTNNVLELLFARSNNGSSELYRNNTLLGSDTYTPRSSGFSNSYEIGRNVALDSRVYMGNISEIIAYNFDQSSNRTGIESNINSFYSIY